MQTAFVSVVTPEFALRPRNLSLPNDGGDILAARLIARRILSPTLADLPVHRLAQVVLTAACLHIQTPVGPDPTFDDLESLLEMLAALHPAAIAGLAGSPMAFVRYLAAELSDSTDAYVDALNLATQAVQLISTKKVK